MKKFLLDDLKYFHSLLEQRGLKLVGTYQEVEKEFLTEGVAGITATIDLKLISSKGNPFIRLSQSNAYINRTAKYYDTYLAERTRSLTIKLQDFIYDEDLCEAYLIVFKNNEDLILKEIKKR